jgi:hypothetical protein
MPIGANDMTYCHIKGIDSQSNRGFIDALYLSTSTMTCVEGIKCSKTDLFIYPTINCKGTPEVHPIGMVWRDVMSFRIGKVLAAKVTINDGTTMVKWNTYFPSSYFYPLLLDRWEWAGTFGYITGAVISLVCSIYFFWLYIRDRFSKFLLQSIISLLWSTHSMLGMLTWFLIQKSILYQVVSRQLFDMMFNLASLGTMYYNLKCILDIKAESQSVYRRIFITAMVLLQIGLSGGKYFSSALYIEKFRRIFIQCNAFSDYWILLLLLVNVGVPIFMSIYFIQMNRSRTKERIAKSMKILINYKILLVFSIGQIIVSSAYGTLFYLQRCTSTLGDDRVVKSFEGLYAFMYNIQWIITLFGSQYYPMIKCTMSKKKKTSRKKSCDVPDKKVVATQRQQSESLTID